MSGARLNLHIDRVVLRGIDPADRQAFANGLKSELAKVLRDPSLRAALTRSRRTPMMRLGRISLEPGLAGARKLGGGVARAIGKGMKP
ncbi:MAG: hypothetical protein WAM85_20995 [Terracidiphilus sp.]